ncbi:MAG: leucine-rich repeat protein [Paludibacteraceae bacterium]
MNRRILFSILVTIFVSLSAQAYDFQVGDLFYNITGNKTVEVTSIEKYSPSYSGMTSMTIPSSVSYDGTTYNVTSIGEYAFYFSVDLTSITIPNSVTSIGGSAFTYCTGLTSITIPNSVTSIGNLAFSNCSSLTSITIPNSVTSIGYFAFEDCSSLTSITIPNSITSIGGSAFSGCDGLVSIVVETGNAFYDSRNNCNAIIETSSNTLIAGCSTTIIPNTISNIGWGAFNGCSGLTSITIPNSVTSIGDYAFNGCSGLTSITIPNSVTSIGSSAFSGCSGLTSITIPNSVTSIGNYAFSRCDGLVSIVVETGNAFYDSRNNCNAIIETSSNTLIAGCSTTIIPNTISNIGWGAFSGCDGLTTITIPNSVTSIGSSAFYGCDGLTSITIPNSVTSIGSLAFGECDNLISITIPNSVISIGEFALSTTPWYWNLPDGIVYINDVLYSYKGTMPQNSSRTIRQGTVSISPYAFISCSGLTSIVIPNSVTSVGIHAFWGCDNLSSITCYANTPPICDLSLGKDNVIVYVPCGSKHLYQADAVWGQVMSIECIEETDIESVESETSKQNTRKAIRNGQVIILKDGEEYTILGQKL